MCSADEPGTSRFVDEFRSICIADRPPRRPAAPRRRAPGIKAKKYGNVPGYSDSFPFTRVHLYAPLCASILLYTFTPRYVQRYFRNIRRCFLPSRFKVFAEVVESRVWHRYATCWKRKSDCFDLSMTWKRLTMLNNDRDIYDLKKNEITKA